MNESTNRAIDLDDLFNQLLLKSKQLSFSLLAVILIVSFYVFNLANEYSSVAYLAPSKDESSLSSGMSRLSDVASFAGLTMGSKELSDADIAIEIIKSRSFIEQFIESHELKVKLYAGRGWDRNTNNLIIDKDIFDLEKGIWGTSFFRSSVEPSNWDLYKIFSKRLSVYKDSKTQLTVVSFKSFSPYMSKYIVDNLVTSINHNLRERALIEANNNLSYLSKQLEVTSIKEMNEVLFDLIKEQTKLKMLIDTSPEYVFQVINKPMLAEEKDGPSRLLILIASGLLTLIFHIFVIIFLFLFRTK